MHFEMQLEEFIPPTLCTQPVHEQCRVHKGYTAGPHQGPRPRPIPVPYPEPRSGAWPACQAMNGPPGLFGGIDGPPGPSIVTIVGPPLP